MRSPKNHYNTRHIRLGTASQFQGAPNGRSNGRKPPLVRRRSSHSKSKNHPLRPHTGKSTQPTATTNANVIAAARAESMGNERPGPFSLFAGRLNGPSTTGADELLNVQLRSQTRRRRAIRPLAAQRFTGASASAFESRSSRALSMLTA